MVQKSQKIGRIIGIIAVLTASWSEAGIIYPYFHIEQVRDKNTVHLVAVNQGPAPVEFVISMNSWTNAQASRSLPTTQIVGPYQRNDAVILYPLNAFQGWNFNYHTQYRMGDPRAALTPGTVFRLPYQDGATFRISQAPGHITTHTMLNSFYAVDIEMPEGTPIVAARDGTVVIAIDGFKGGGASNYYLDKANVIRILHDDGTWADYAHLKLNGVMVRTGQRIKAGEIIGLSGSTGYSSGPHLHFSVGKNNGSDEISLPFQFFTKKEGVFNAGYGMLLTADYSQATKMAETQNKPMNNGARLGLGTEKQWGNAGSKNAWKSDQEQRMEAVGKQIFKGAHSLMALGIFLMTGLTVALIILATIDKLRRIDREENAQQQGMTTTTTQKNSEDKKTSLNDHQKIPYRFRLAGRHSARRARREKIP